MLVVIVTSGSRGDVQPYVTLALELQKRGATVRIATEERMRSLVEELGRSGGVQYASISGDPTGMLFEKKYQALLAKGSILPVLKAVDEHNKEFYEQVLVDTAAACEGADIIVSAPLCLTATMCMAEKLDIPWVPVVLGPVMPTGEFPSWAISYTPFRFKWLNRASYRFIFWALWQQEAARINRWRTTSLGLKPLCHGPAAIVGACDTVMMCSAHLVPGQKLPPDYDAARHHMTGFAFLPATPDEAVEQRLKDFVARGPDKPLYLGFGSMPAPDPQALLQLADQVVEQTGRPAVLVAGWSELDAAREAQGGHAVLNEQLLVVPHVPHDWLLPRCCVAVHHCGVGTCGAVLRAGIPSVPCPVMLDQPALALRLQEAGVACAPLPFHKLTAETLTQRIKLVLASPDMQARAAQVAEEIALDYKGVAEAADRVLNAVKPWPQPAGRT